MKRMWMVGVLALVVAAVAATPAGAAGNSDNAKLCQKEGWRGLMDASGARFRGQGDCVSSGAHRGPIYPLASLELTLCATQPADGICFRVIGTGLKPASAIVVTPNFAPIFALPVPPSGSLDATAESSASPCMEGQLLTATATATSADSLSTPVVPGITVTSNTVTRTASCP